MRRNNYKWIGCMLLTIVMLSLSACNKEDDGLSTDKQEVHLHKVCVIAPYANLDRWKRTAKWALDNIAAAQKGLPHREELELVWMNEETLTLEDYIAISEDASYVAVVGPFESNNAQMLAERHRKPTMLLPSATSAEFQRRFADVKSIWNLSESDISQLHIMLAQIATGAIKEVALITRKNDQHGETFANWIGFFATEYRITINGIYTYESENELKDIVRKLNNETFLSSIIFDPGNDSDALAFDEVLTQLVEGDDSYVLGEIMCTDRFVSENIAKKVKNNYEGLDLCADPNSGFSKAYLQKFNAELINGEAQFYDAFLLLSYALTGQRSYPELTLDDAIKMIVTTEGQEAGSWLPADSYYNFEALQRGIFLALTGASSIWQFEEKTLSTVVSSTYRHWRLNGGKYHTMEYLSVYKGRRVASPVAAWNMNSQVLQKFDKNSKDFIYPALKDKWCLLIATSTEWADYRHQSDVYAMYQIMKRSGFKDDHIILIAEDNLAYHPSNPSGLKGQVLAEPDKNNVYQDVKVDYKISGVTLDDLKNILCGNRNEHLPEVIEAGSSGNIFIFWSGHGNSRGSFKFGNEYVTSAQMKNMFLAMHREKKYRKMFMAMEACYSGQLGQTCTEIPGMLFLMAANAYEQSWSYGSSSLIDPYLSDKFARYFQLTVEKYPLYSFQDIYTELAKTVPGSHVSLYNDMHFGNMYNNYLDEFLVYDN